ncbi:hypothetical protein MAR_014734 [Mya arenaria]|uniref:Uncharacterized protein n=1 Tax=Mya arenaria TaxID=6604 RepID=A0ABY7FFA2_MYAAR|nr:hypothetical protein MAR_014734 [Mya arenaria]
MWLVERMWKIQKLFTSNVLGRRKIRPAQTKRTCTILYRATLNIVMLWKDVKTIKKYQQ